MHKPNMKKATITMLTLVSLTVFGRGFASQSAETNPADAPALHSQNGLRTQPETRLVTYYVVDDTCPAAVEAVEIRERRVARSVRPNDAEVRADLLQSVNRVLTESMREARFRSLASTALPRSGQTL